MRMNIKKFQKEYHNGFAAGFFGWFMPGISSLTQAQATAIRIGYVLGKQAAVQLTAI